MAAMKTCQARTDKQVARRAAEWRRGGTLVLARGPVANASAADNYNTAAVSYRLAGEPGATKLQSNTVRTEVLLPSNSAQLVFLGDDADIPGRQPTAIDGGQCRIDGGSFMPLPGMRSEEHTSELQSLMRISYAVFCLKKKTKN